MQKLFDVATSTGSHPVTLTDEALAAAVDRLQPRIVLADAVFRDRLAGVTSRVIFIEAVEPSKDLARMGALIEQCRAAGLTRNDLLLAVGGGVIQDISGFVASIYMRGVRWIYLPTTLLAMVDSCIGGKSSINVGDFKNLVGTFYPPDEVVIAPHVLDTLDPIHVAAGRVEAAKICYARSEESFERFLARDDGSVANAGPLVAESLGGKRWFVEIDEFDRGERLLLNFGHSFGHVVESCTGYRVPHGVAVGVGCLAAMAMSRGGGDPPPDAPGVTRALDAKLRAILGAVPDLDADLKSITPDIFFRYFAADKKHSRSAYRPVLVDGAGRLYRAELPRTAETEAAIWQAFSRARDVVARDRGATPAL